MLRNVLCSSLMVVVGVMGCAERLSIEAQAGSRFSVAGFAGFLDGGLGYFLLLL